MFRLRNWVPVLALAVVGATSSTASAVIILDDFTVGAGPFVSGAGPALQGPTATGTGTNRTLSSSVALMAGDQVGIDSGTQNLQVFLGTGSSQVALFYNGFGTVALNPAGSISLEFEQVNPGTGQTELAASIVLHTTTGDLTQTYTQGSLAIADPNVVRSFLLSGFTGPGSLNSVTGISFLFNTNLTESPDFQVSYGLNTFELPNLTGDPIPEPATVATFGLMAVGGLFVARRRMKNAVVAAV